MQVHLNDFLFSVSRALDSIENEFLGVTVNHSKRAAYISMRLCEQAGCTREEIFDMASCAILHDNALTEYALYVGKHGAATLENVAFHCKSGEENASHFPFIGDTKNIVLHHHENWDGSGFFGIFKQDLSIRAGALRIADNVDLLFALGTPTANLHEAVRAHMLSSRATLYHPELTDAFVKLLDAGMLEELTDAHIDASLAKIMPDCSRNIDSAEMLQACAVFASIIDSRSRFTLRHTVGIARKVAVMADYYKLSREHRDVLVISAYLHDIGKLTIPLDILEKPGVLNKEEFDIMKGHALASYTILRSIRGLEDVALWAPSHHERLDGSGYPHGKKAEEQGKESRLLACVDVYQALREDRPYRAGMDHGAAMHILYTLAGNGKLDGDIIKDMEKIFGRDVCLIPSVHVPTVPIPGGYPACASE